MLFVPAVAGAAFWWAAAKAYDVRERLDVPVELESQDPAVKAPFQGYFDHISKWNWVSTRGRFQSVQESTDVNGAIIFLVDYGNGSKVVQYFDPRILV
jgi:hypothetical protein